MSSHASEESQENDSKCKPFIILVLKTKILDNKDNSRFIKALKSWKFLEFQYGTIVPLKVLNCLKNPGKLLPPTPPNPQLLKPEYAITAQHTLLEF